MPCGGGACHPVHVLYALVLAWYLSVGTLADMLADLLALDFCITSIIRASSFCSFIVYLCDVGIHALLSTFRLTLVISVRTVILQMFLQIFPHEAFDFIVIVLAQF